MADRYLIPDLVTMPEGVPMPESMKKKVEKYEKLKLEKESARAAKKAARKVIRENLCERSIGYEREYEAANKELIEARRTAKANGGFYRDPEAKVMFAMRLKGINKLAPKPKKILQLFRLRQIHNGVFIRANKATMNMVHVITPFITFGFPSLKTIRALVYKRGYAKVGKAGAWSRKRLLDNDIISSNLGKFGIHGVEDIVHEIYTCGPHFKEVNNFLWPFKLDSPKGGWNAKRRGFADPRGGDWGAREGLINPLIMRMN